MRLSVMSIACGLWITVGAAYAAPVPKATTTVPPDEDLEAAKQTAVAQTSIADVTTGKPLDERIRAVSRRTFLKADRFEIEPLVSISLSDPFFRSWGAGLRGSYHLSEEFAIDIGGAYSFYQQELNAFRVIADGIVTAPKAVSLTAVVDGGVTFSPIYGKVGIASEYVLHFDTYASAGLAAIVDTNVSSSFHPGAEIGIGSRVFLNRFLAIRLDVRDYLYPTSFDRFEIANSFVLNAGLSIYFPLDFDYAAETLGAQE
jgi:outer membrane beta-barrel protein